MLKLIITLFAISAVLTLCVLGFQLYQSANMSQEAFALSQDVQKLKLQKEIADIERAKQQDAITFRLAAVKIQNKETLAQSGMVAASRELGAATLYLWPVFCVLGSAMGAGCYLYATRQKAVVQIQTARNTLLIQEETAVLKTLEKSMPALVRGMLAAVPRQAEIVAPEPVDVPEPQALPTWTGHVHFSQAAQDPDYDPRNILLGRDMEAGNTRHRAMSDMESLCINGIQKTGKSTLLKAIAHNSLLRQYVYRENVKTVLIDIHAGAPTDSLSQDLEDMCPGILGLFDKTFLGEEQIENGLVSYFDGLFASFAPGQTPETEELVILFDETTETISCLDSGKEIAERTKRLFNRRKYGVRVVLAVFESTKNKNSAMGLNVSRMAVSKALFQMDADDGRRFMKLTDERCDMLQKGEYFLKTPGDLEVSMIKAPLLSDLDFRPFLKYIEKNAPQAARDDDTPDATEDTGLTPERVKEAMTESLSQTARKAGIPKGTLSNFLNKKGGLSDVQQAAITALLWPGSEKIVNLEQRRKSLFSQG